MRNTLLFAVATVCLMALVGFVASKFIAHSAAPALPAAPVVASVAPGNVAASAPGNVAASAPGVVEKASPSTTKAAAKPSAAPAAAMSEVIKQLQALVTKVQAKLETGDQSESDYAPELQEFDALLAAHKDEKTNDVAQVAGMKAALYFEVFDEQGKAVEMLKQLEKDFPGTAVAKEIAADLPQMQAEVAADAPAAAIRHKLLVGTAFPDFAVKDLGGQPLSVAKYKGKIVLVDFWATWCGPCMAEMPNVIQAYNQYHDKGFEIIGVSLDDDPAQLKAFLQQKKLAWPQFNDGKQFDNELAVKYGINAIPANYLLDGDGRIIGRGLRGENLTKAVAAAVSAK
jgi:thiol-disulfide isomerase/thioredoxin